MEIQETRELWVNRLKIIVYKNIYKNKNSLLQVHAEYNSKVEMCNTVYQYN